MTAGKHGILRLIRVVFLFSTLYDINIANSDINIAVHHDVGAADVQQFTVQCKLALV